MNLEIEIHDSELISISNHGHWLELWMNVYIHKSEGTPGVDAGTGWEQLAILILENGVVDGTITNWPAELSGGSLTIDGRTHENSIPVPLDTRGQVELTLKPKFFDDPIVVRASHVRLELSQWVPRYVEDFPGMAE